MTNNSLADLIFNDKKLWEKRARIYQEALNQIAEYVDSHNTDIGLTEYSNIMNIISQSDKEIGKL